MVNDQATFRINEDGTISDVQKTSGLEKKLEDQYAGEKRERFTQVYTGSREYVEEHARTFERHVCKVAKYQDAIEMYKKEYKYVVELCFAEEQSQKSHGVGETYESARAAAEENFPYEVNAAVKEEVKLIMDLYFPKTLRNKLNPKKKKKKPRRSRRRNREGSRGIPMGDGVELGMF